MTRSFAPASTSSSDTPRILCSFPVAVPAASLAGPPRGHRDVGARSTPRSRHFAASAPARRPSDAGALSGHWAAAAASPPRAARGLAPRLTLARGPSPHRTTAGGGSGGGRAAAAAERRRQGGGGYGGSGGGDRVPPLPGAARRRHGAAVARVPHLSRARPAALPHAHAPPCGGRLLVGHARRVFACNFTALFRGPRDCRINQFQAKNGQNFLRGAPPRTPLGLPPQTPPGAPPQTPLGLRPRPRRKAKISRFPLGSPRSRHLDFCRNFFYYTVGKVSSSSTRLSTSDKKFIGG